MTGDYQATLAAGPAWRVRLAGSWPILLLTAVGLLWSLSFWHHFVFPNSDYYSFVTTGRQWLSFEIPTSMKRAPVFSLIAGLISMSFARPLTQLMATEMYNALLLPTSMILFYLVGRGLLGRPVALVVALLAGISPWMVRMSSEALAEMTLLALFAAGVLSVARGRMGWAYVLAMLASLTRWDLAGLIPAVALADLVHQGRFRRVLVKAALASVPLVLCLVITKWQLAGEERGAHYLQVLSEERGFALLADLRRYWEVMLAGVMVPPAWKTAGGFRVLRGVTPFVFWLTAVPLAVAFLWGEVEGVAKRRAEVLVMLVTGVPYVLVHAVYPYRLDRYCVPMAWAALVIAAYGAERIVTALQNRWAAWRRARPVLLAGGALLFAAWAAGAAWTLEMGVEQKVCPGIGAVVAWSAGVTLAGYFGYEWLRAARPGLQWLVVPAFLVLATVSSGTETAVKMGDGNLLASFKTLSLWFKANARPDDRMMTNMPHYMPLYTDLPSDRFVHTGSIPPEAAPDFPGFIKACRRMGVTLIAWDSGLAGNPQDRYYKLWGLERVHPLGLPFMGRPVERIGPCKLVYLIPEDRLRIAVWRIGPEN